MEEVAVCLEISREEIMENVNSTNPELQRECECLEPEPESKIVEDVNSTKLDLKRDRECLESEQELEPDESPNKKQAKEVSNEDIRSEVSNPTVSPQENTSTFHDISSRNQVGCGEVTSLCSGSSSSEETLSESSETADASGVVSTSKVTLEIPKHLSSSGIRKITFKFSKKKEDYENETTYSVGGECMNPENYYGNSSVEWNSRYSFAPNMELKMSKKVVPSNYPSNVRELLGTGILDGARVKYISPTMEVLSAYEFEQHAGHKTRHPNNHIYLENGKPIYNIIQELKTAPIGILDDVLKDVAGSSINEESFQDWKASLQRSNRKVEAEKKYNMKPRSLPNSRRPNFGVSKQVLPKKRTVGGGTRKRVGRDNDLHRLLFMPNGLPDGAELSYFIKGQKLLKGYKQGNGIVCNCCESEVSPSQFEAHAGMAARRQPYRHIYTSNGLTLHDIALSLANGQCVTTGYSDDMCAICGDSGDLLLCCECPQAFHPDKSNSGIARPIVIRLTRVVKAPEVEIGGCVVCRIHDALQSSVSNGVQIIPTPFSNIIRRKHLEKGLFINGTADDVEWRILSGKSRYPEHLPLLSSAAAIFRECFDPIVAQSGRDLIPVMVYGRNISGQEFGGMYCVVLIVRSVVVSAGLLRIFGQEVAELPIVATSREHQGKGYFQALFACIERLLSSLKVENLVLPAAEEALSIWTKKFGFTKMSEQQLSKYQRELQLTIFKGTSMLEKKVQLISE
ncbi:Zinc finger, RING/FYVE/PHD-type [Corchorus olitorius]|uniref:Zinc finger, RING/FYVE/PHD-type n=1 Tax=Corchorus olitorius TaxID=93759 RepID=A0A1R3JQT1_9ROSI|nr:Zinc finger, RING/FYVE/PHD-type [Corchorus olitorius]